MLMTGNTDLRFRLATFTDREGELDHLHRSLQRTSAAPIWLIGSPGVGKTALVAEYAARYEHDYAAAVHVSAANLSDARLLPALIAAEIGGATGDHILRARGLRNLDDEFIPFERLLKALPSRSPLLLVIDDADALPQDQLRTVLRYIDRKTLRLRIIVIARTYQRQATGRYNILELANLSQNNLTDLLRRRLAYAGQDEAIAEQLIREVGAQVDLSLLTPRLLLRVAHEFLRRGDPIKDLTNAILTHFGEATNLIITPEDKRLRVVATTALEETQVLTPSSLIITTAPLVFVPGYSRYWRTRLDQLEELVNARRVKEADLQEFFEQNEILLRGIDYERAIAHPVLKRDDDGDLIPDFFLKPLDSDFVDILDLKLPTEKLTVGTRDRRRFSAAVSEAIAQVREYRAYFERPKYRERVRAVYGVSGYRPSSAVVIGRTPDEGYDEGQRRIFDDLPRHVRIVTYDDLLARMRASMWQNNA